MTRFCFIRHGEKDASELGTKCYQGLGSYMCFLTSNGVNQVKEAAKLSELSDAEIIITSPYGRTMHTAAVLSKELGIDMIPRTGLHEWCANKDFEYLVDPVARANYREFKENGFNYPEGEEREWESKDIICKRVAEVLKDYLCYKKVIVVCHGTLMQCVLGCDHPGNAEVIAANADELECMKEYL